MGQLKLKPQEHQRLKSKSVCYQIATIVIFLNLQVASKNQYLLQKERLEKLEEEKLFDFDYSYYITTKLRD